MILLIVLMKVWETCLCVCVCVCWERAGGWWFCGGMGVGGFIPTEAAILSLVKVK